MILANKQDLDGAMTASEISEVRQKPSMALALFFHKKE